MDVHVPRAITEGLRLHNVDVLTAQEDDARRLTDRELLYRASSLHRILFTRDVDLLTEEARRQQAGWAFDGLIYAHQLHVSIGQCIRDLEILAMAGEPDDFVSRVYYLPLR
jgi:predicted nuclease of predicted toxin-antitoxin system